MIITLGEHPLLLGLGLFALAAAAWWSYRRTTPELPLVPRAALGTVRFMALGLILFLLFEPLWTRERSDVRTPLVHFLVDASQSMSLSGSDGTGQGSDVHSRIDAIENELSGIPLRTLFHGTALVPADSVRADSFAAPQTDLDRALRQLIDNIPEGVVPGPVILLSDGLYNTGANPLAIAERYPVPIIAIAHGDTTRRRDVRIQQVLFNSLSYTGSDVPVRVRIRSEGAGEQPTNVTLSRDGQILDNVTTTLPDTGEIVVDLSYTAEDPGLQRLQIMVSEIPGEANTRNNVEEIGLQVLDQRKRVLLVAGSPSPETAAWRRHLESDPDIELATRIQKQPGQWHEGPLPDSLESWDLFVLVGFPGQASSSSDSQRLAEAAGSGVPTLFVADRSLDTGMLARDWNGVLAVTPDAPRQSWAEVSFRPRPAASTHPVFDHGQSGLDEGFWQRMFPVMANETRWNLLPGASVLAGASVRDVDLDQPLFVVGRVGQTRTAALLASGTWRWRLVPKDLERESAAWLRIQENIVSWLYATDDERLVRVSPASVRMAEGTPIMLTGEVYDETLAPEPNARVSLTVRSADGTELPVGMQPVGQGRYTADLGRLPAGEYTYTATASVGGEDLGTDRGEFVVGQQSLEFRTTQADYNLMAQLAGVSGGVFIAPDEISMLRERLMDLPAMRTVTRTMVSQNRLWQKYPFLVAILILLTIEWFFRKRLGMV